MRTFKKSFSVVISIILCFTVLSQTATAGLFGNKTLYVEDLKIIYADSEKEAKEQLPDGYQLVPGNINAETGELVELLVEWNQEVTLSKLAGEGS